MSQDGSAPRAFGNAGQINDVDLALGDWGVTPDQVQRIVTHPIIANRVVRALRGDGDVMGGVMTQDDWVGQELVGLRELSKCGMPPVDPDRVARAWQAGYDLTRCYMPGDLRCEWLLRELLPAVGMQHVGEKIIEARGEHPTEEGVFTCDLSRIMTPTNRKGHPFWLNYKGQLVWAQEQGGNDLTSAEETLYLLARAYIALGHFPFAGGMIRCRNRVGSGSYRMRVECNSAGLVVLANWIADADSGYDPGAIPRKFKALGAKRV